MKKYDSKLRALISILSLIAFFSGAVGVYFYYSTLKKDAITWAHMEAEEHLKIIGDHFQSNISWSQKAAKALAGSTELEKFLVSGDDAGRSVVNSVLDNFNRTLEADVCYVMDRSGNTLASSNRNAADSFVGKNFDFRPYFQQGMKGVPAVFMALGSVSKKRGIYFSHPVYRPGQKRPSGVAVIKTSIQSIEESFKKAYDGILLLVDPLGVVFVSDRPDWLFHVLWNVSPEKIAGITETHQFGKGPFKWTGVKPWGKNQAVDKQGNLYRVHRYEIANHHGWQLIYLHNEHVVYEKFATPINRSVGLTAVILCCVFGIVISFLYLKTRNEIVRRSAAEEKNRKLILELQESIVKVKRLSGLLPICASCKKIRDDKGYWNQIESYIHTHSEAEFSHGICPECAKKLYPDFDILDKNEIKQ